MNILLIDNYDSFTYNLAATLQRVTGHAPVVKRNNELSLSAIAGFDKIVLSPGPGVPSEAGMMPEVIKRFAPHKSILGVCLGHQAIGEVFGGALENLTQMYHGVATTVNTLREDLLFAGLPDTFTAGRYHSWVIRKETLPDVLEVTAEDDKGHIMAIRHKQYNTRGIQFHPESIMTPVGQTIISNWINS